MLEIDYFLLLFHTKRADGMMAKCGLSLQRFAFPKSFPFSLQEMNIPMV